VEDIHFFNPGYITHAHTLERSLQLFIVTAHGFMHGFLLSVSETLGSGTERGTERANPPSN